MKWAFVLLLLLASTVARASHEGCLTNRPALRISRSHPNPGTILLVWDYCPFAPFHLLRTVNFMAWEQAPNDGSTCDSNGHCRVFRVEQIANSPRYFYVLERN